MISKTVSQLIETSKAKWKNTKTPGIDFVALHADASEKRGTFLYRMAANTIFPKHRHPGGEEMLILRGDLKVADRILKAGDFLISPPGSIHDLSTQAGCMFLVLAPKGIEIIPGFADGEMDAQPEVLSAAPQVPYDASIDPREIDPEQISTEIAPPVTTEES